MNEFLTKQRAWILLSAILLVGLLLRLFQLGAESLWEDEAVDFCLSLPNVNDLVYAVREKARGGLPLYYLIIAVIKRLGQAEWVLRMPSVLFSFGAIAFTYLFSRRVYSQDKLSPWLATGLMALSTFQIRYAQENRYYSLLVFLCLGLWWLLLRAVQENDWKIWLLYGVLGLGAGYAHYYVFIAMGSQIIYLLIAQVLADRDFSWKKRLQPVLAASGVLLLALFLFIPGMILFTSNTGHYNEFVFSMGQWLVIAKTLAGCLWPAAIFLLLLPLIWGSQRLASVGLAAAAASALVVILGLDWAMGYFFHLRQIIFIQPLILILMARALTQLLQAFSWKGSIIINRWIQGLSIFLFFILVPLPVLKAYFSYDSALELGGKKPAWRVMVQEYAQRSVVNSALICWQTWDLNYVGYYMLRNQLMGKRPMIDAQGEVKRLQTMATVPHYAEYWFIDNGDFHSGRTRLTAQDKAWLEKHVVTIKTGYGARLGRLVLETGAQPVSQIDFKIPDFRQFLGIGWHYESQVNLRHEVKSRKPQMLKLKRGLRDLIYPHPLAEAYYLPNAQEVVWSSGAQSSLIIPMNEAPPRRLRLRIAAPIPLAVSFSLNGHPFTSILVSADWAEYAIDLRTAKWIKGNNILLLTYPPYHTTSERNFSLIWNWCKFEY